MPAIGAGVRAPEINLLSVDGSKFASQDTLKRGPLVAAFFKVSCPVCQLALPYVERLFKAYGKNGRVTLVGVSQDNAADTKEFNSKFGVTFPTLLDEKGKYPASNAYGLTNVPSTFLIDPQSEIELSSVGWSKAEMERLNHRLAEVSGLQPKPLFAPGEKIPEFKPG